MEPVAGHPLRRQDVAGHRTGRRKQRTVNPLLVPATSTLPQGRLGGQPPAAAVLGRQHRHRYRGRRSHPSRPMIDGREARSTCTLTGRGHGHRDCQRTSMQAPGGWHASARGGWLGIALKFICMALHRCIYDRCPMDAAQGLWERAPGLSVHRQLPRLPSRGGLREPNKSSSRGPRDRGPHDLRHPRPCL